jgi:hypothetical protein
MLKIGSKIRTNYHYPVEKEGVVTELTEDLVTAETPDRETLVLPKQCVSEKPPDLSDLLKEADDTSFPSAGELLRPLIKNNRLL